MMGAQQRQEATRTRRRTAALRCTMHILILATIILVVGVMGLTATAAEIDEAVAPIDAPVASTAVQSPADVQLQVGDAVALDGGALIVTLVAVTEDSRCPRDVVCVWSGRAVVALHVELDGADRGNLTATLMPGGRGPQAGKLDAVVERYTLALTDLQPYPDRSHPEPTPETVATLHIVQTP